MCTLPVIKADLSCKGQMHTDTVECMEYAVNSIKIRMAGCHCILITGKWNVAQQSEIGARKKACKRETEMKSFCSDIMRNHGDLGSVLCYAMLFFSVLFRSVPYDELYHCDIVLFCHCVVMTLCRLTLRQLTLRRLTLYRLPLRRLILYRLTLCHFFVLAVR